MEAKVFRSLLAFVMSLAHPPRGPRRLFCDRWIIMFISGR